MLSRSELISLYRVRGALAYEGEGVTQLQHGWQCAGHARRAGAPASLVLAAWLHDLGHLMTDLSGTPTVDGIDDGHEVLGGAALEPLFGPEVSQPVALHVAAKRYLVATQGTYRDALSADSMRSLALQGGPMTAEERASFVQSPFALDAQRLRVWDDLAKMARLKPANADIALAELEALMGQVGRRN
jgi:predicted HD phosphohydrolase